MRETWEEEHKVLESAKSPFLSYLKWRRQKWMINASIFLSLCLWYKDEAKRLCLSYGRVCLRFPRCYGPPCPFTSWVGLESFQPSDPLSSGEITFRVMKIMRLLHPGIPGIVPMSESTQWMPFAFPMNPVARKLAIGCWILRPSLMGACFITGRERPKQEPGHNRGRTNKQSISGWIYDGYLGLGFIRMAV